MRPLLLVLAVFSVAVAPAVAAKDPRLAYLQNTLKADMVKTFKKQAPSLRLTTVRCVIPQSGAVSRCKAFFTVGKTRGYYPVTATLHDLGGKLTWTAKSPKCWVAAKKTYRACSSA